MYRIQFSPTRSYDVVLNLTENLEFKNLKERHLKWVNFLRLNGTS